MSHRQKSYVKIAGLPGKVYLPVHAACGTKKHKCPDCLVCQNCGETRCRICRKRKSWHQQRKE